MLIPAHRSAVRTPAKGKRTVARGIAVRVVEEPMETPARSPRSLGWRFWDLYHAIVAEVASDKVYKATIGRPSSGNWTLQNVGGNNLLRLLLYCQIFKQAVDTNQTYWLKLWSIREGRVIQSANFAADCMSTKKQ